MAIMPKQKRPEPQMYYPGHCAGAEGDFATQSSDDTDQENDQYEERAGWGEEEQNSSGSEEPAKGELDITEEGEVFGETFGTGPESEADTTGNGNVLWEDSRDYSTDEGQEGDSSKEGQDMEGGNLGDLPGSPGMVGDTFGDMLERGELPQDSSREMANRGIQVSQYHASSKNFLILIFYRFI